MAAAVFIGAALIAHNILAAIIAHLLYNIPWTIGIWRRMDVQLERPKSGWEIGWADKMLYGAFIILNFGMLIFGIKYLQG